MPLRKAEAMIKRLLPHLRVFDLFGWRRFGFVGENSELYSV